MANDISTIKSRANLIAKVAAGRLSDKLQFCKTIDKEEKEILKGKNGFNSGDTISVNVPTRFISDDSADITGRLQDIKEEKAPLVFDKREVVPISLTSAELATDFNINSIKERVIDPAMDTISASMEAKALRFAAEHIYNHTLPGFSNKFGTRHMTTAGSLLDISGCSSYSNRFALLNPAANVEAVDQRKGLFQSSEKIRKQYEEGAMGIADGLTYLRNNLLATTQNGNDVSGVAVETAPIAGANTFVVDGLTANTGTVKKGSVFTIDGVFRVHPLTKAVLPQLQPFVVLGDVTADTNGEATVEVSPSFLPATAGAQQNISALPAPTAALVFAGIADQILTSNLVYHKSAFRLGVAPLIKPEGMDMVGEARVDGITVRIVRGFDILTDKMITRMDVLWGIAAVRPEWSVRVLD
jgi:hypothetical protein